MNDLEKLERLKSLESSADSCIHEISGLLPELSTAQWDSLRDDIQSEIDRLEENICICAKKT